MTYVYVLMEVVIIPLQIITVNPPLFGEHEYQYPPTLANEPGLIDLYDGSGDQADVYLGEYFQVRGFQVSKCYNV